MFIGTVEDTRHNEVDRSHAKLYYDGKGSMS